MLFLASKKIFSIMETVGLYRPVMTVSHEGMDFISFL